MSWGISLSGPKAIIRRELEDAKRVFDSVLAHLERHDVDAKDSLSVNVNGYVSWDQDGKVTSASTGHLIAVTPYQEPQPEPVPALNVDGAQS